MKKYIKPSCAFINFNAGNILDNTSSVGFGGSNSNGGPDEAESKGYNIFFYQDQDEEE